MITDKIQRAISEINHKIILQEWATIGADDDDRDAIYENGVANGMEQALEILTEALGIEE